MPFMSSSGMAWRCWIGPVMFFYRNHGAILLDTAAAGIPTENEVQATIMVARYTSAEDNHYFGWSDAAGDDARSLADRFSDRFVVLAPSGKGWDYAYAGWYERLLGLAEGGCLPVVISDYSAISYDRIPLDDMRPAEWRRSGEEVPVLPLPPPGQLQQDHQG